MPKPLDETMTLPDLSITQTSAEDFSENSDTKSIFMLSAEQVLQWCADLSIHIGTCKQEGWIKQAEVNACTTKEELDAIILE